MKGGAEAVCMNTLQALQDDHELELLTLTRPDIDELNEYYRTNVDWPTVNVANNGGRVVNEQLGNTLNTLQAALLNRHIRSYQSEFDLLLSTRNEFAVDIPSVQYVHSPQFHPDDPGLHGTDSPSLVRMLYRRGCRSLAGVSENRMGSVRMLANSKWTAAIVQEQYNTSPEVIYPPVDTEISPETDWADREDGFLAIGRVGPSKNLLTNIEVIDRVQERGHDIHIHIIGPSSDDDYARTVRREAEERAYVAYEGEVSRSELHQFIANHRYGLHGRPYEHFGMVIAEMTAGGMITFAPDTGGQCEILGENEELLYGTLEEAVEKIGLVLTDHDRQDRLQRALHGTENRFSRESFRSNLRTIVQDEL
jgi:glycosyltransferase involved in cell wall biosynthesis